MQNNSESLNVERSFTHRNAAWYGKDVPYGEGVVDHFVVMLKEQNGNGADDDDALLAEFGLLWKSTAEGVALHVDVCEDSEPFMEHFSDLLTALHKAGPSATVPDIYATLASLDIKDVTEREYKDAADEGLMDENDSAPKNRFKP